MSSRSDMSEDLDTLRSSLYELADSWKNQGIMLATSQLGAAMGLALFVAARELRRILDAEV